MSQAEANPKERRQFRRSVVGMPVHALRRTTTEDDPRRLVGLHVMNVSRGGIGAITQELLDHREPLLLFFPPLGPGRGRDTPCQVLRCTQCEEGFAVGIAFEDPWPERDDVRVG